MLAGAGRIAKWKLFVESFHEYCKGQRTIFEPDTHQSDSIETHKVFQLYSIELRPKRQEINLI